MEAEKKCSVCGQIKPLVEFYKRSSSPDVWRANCKSCVLQTVQARYIRKAEIIRAYDRKRSKLPHRKAGLRARLARLPVFKKSAQSKANHAALHGKIPKTPCVICGTKQVEGHHQDYTKPLEIVWLCRPHHRQLHAGRFSLLLHAH